MKPYTEGPYHWKPTRTLMHLHNVAGSSFAQVSMPIPTKRNGIKIADAMILEAAPQMYELLNEIFTDFDAPSWLLDLRRRVNTTQ